MTNESKDRVRHLSPESVSPPIGLYSHVGTAPAGRSLVAIAGQVAVDAAGKPAGGGVKRELPMVMASLDNIVRSCGGSLADVVKFTTYLVDPDDISEFYEARAELWPELFPNGKYPPNTLLVVRRLVRPEFHIEIEAVAAIL